jgi:diguanylate cyclase (GGDEF)-like protein
MVLNGEDAVQFALREIPHLIIIDGATPGVDACELVRCLRNHPKSMHIPIIMLSAGNSRADRIRAIELGVDGYIPQPCDVDELLAYVHRQLHRIQQTSLSPLTQLPGGVQLEHAIDHKLGSMEPWSILYLDLDNFKAFNDVYGFLAGNDMILLVGRTCQRTVYDYGNTDDFVGHIGGDDFIIITTPDRETVLYRQILARYKRESIALYRPEDIERGSISGVDRKGRPYQFPLVSLSIGIVSDQWHSPYSLDEVGTLAAQAKRFAKQSSTNVYQVSPSYNASSHCYSHSPRTLSSLCDVSRFARNLLYSVQDSALAEFK